jgi:membrane-associated HD superfamily phosphohydrolase
MKLIPSTILLAGFLAWMPLSAQGIPVIDASAIVQAIEAVRLATQQLEQAKTELERLGDPGAIKTPAANQLLQSLGLIGAGRTLVEIQMESTGTNGTTFNANGLYRTPTEVLQTAGGTVVPRAVEEYRKFDAVAQSVKTLEDVMYDTEERRQSLRTQIQQALKSLQKATTVAEVQKLQGLLSALNAELGAVDRERDTALSRVVVQGIYNQTDAARQQQARREETEASVRQATEKLGTALKVDTSPIRIPNPTVR